RRHTRFSRDWSSDVCSSDLYTVITGFNANGVVVPVQGIVDVVPGVPGDTSGDYVNCPVAPQGELGQRTGQAGSTVLNDGVKGRRGLPGGIVVSDNRPDTTESPVSSATPTRLLYNRVTGTPSDSG